MYVNSTLGGDANAAARMIQYQQIAKDIKDIVDGTTPMTGLSTEIAEKAGKQDKAAKIKARLTMISITMAISEPLSKGLIDAATASAITGATITNENDLFAKAEEMFTSVKTDIGTLGLIDTEMSNLGIDVPSVYARMAENYMILALKAMGPVKNIDDADALLKDMQAQLNTVKEQTASGTSIVPMATLTANQTVLTNAIAKLNPVFTGKSTKKVGLSQNATKYITNMNKYLADALKKATDDGNSAAKAKVILIQAQYAGWTGGTDKANFDKAKGLYDQVQTLNSGIMDAKAQLDYANVLSVISFMNHEQALPANITAIYEKVKASDNGATGAKACIELANLQAAFAKTDAAKLTEAKNNIYEALKRLTGSAKTSTMEYVDAVNGMIAMNKGAGIDKSIIQALCYLGTIEGRLYTVKADADRLSGYAAMKGILGGIGNVTGGINKIIRPYAGDPSLKLVVDEFTRYQEQVVLSWGKAGGDQKSAEYVSAMNKSMNYDARVEDAIKKLTEIK